MSSNETLAETSYIRRHDMFHSGMIEALTFGLYTAIVFFTIHKIASERGAEALRGPLVLVMMLMYICAIINLQRLWEVLQHAFVDDAATLKGTLKALGSSTTAKTVVAIITRGLLMLIGDCIMIWRCWRLYAHSWAVTAPPLILALGQLAVLLTRVGYEARQGVKLDGSELVVGQLRVAQLSLTLATTVIVTALIVYRIVRMGGFKRYSDIIAILVESAALYSFALIIYMPFPFHPIFFDTIPYAVLLFMPGIASTLIIARVSLGRGIEHTFNEKATHTGISGGDVSTLQFRQTTAGTRGVRTETGNGSYSRDTGGHDTQMRANTQSTDLGSEEEKQVISVV